VLLQLDGCN